MFNGKGGLAEDAKSLGLNKTTTTKLDAMH